MSTIGSTGICEGLKLCKETDIINNNNNNDTIQNVTLETNLIEQFEDEFGNNSSEKPIENEKKNNKKKELKVQFYEIFFKGSKIKFGNKKAQKPEVLITEPKEEYSLQENVNNHNNNDNKPQEREKWSRKTEFLLAIIGFSVDLGNVWRCKYYFPNKIITID